MDHEIEYDEAMVTSLELIWGRGFMAPGGEGHVGKMVKNIETQGKRILDIGTGLGGPAFILAKKFGAKVVGTDIEEHLIDIAKSRAPEYGAEDSVEFKYVNPGPLDFPDNSFDIIFSSGAFTQIDKKLEIYLECFRVLKPGGYLTLYDWMKPVGEYSQDMLYWFETEGLTYAMETPEEHKKIYKQAGFSNIVIEESSAWYRKKAREEYQQIQGELFPKILSLMGKEGAEQFLENWRALVIVCNKGEMLQVYSRGQKII